MPKYSINVCNKCGDVINIPAANAFKFSNSAAGAYDFTFCDQQNSLFPKHINYNSRVYIFMKQMMANSSSTGIQQETRSSAVAEKLRIAPYYSRHVHTYFLSLPVW